eukprot:snap_masked-scaffold_10-processed-gene-1.49-mRNA-1 protein AED:1.00 eAED:1.00 QI:0/0/0/0/1/1/2/0/91
MIFIRNFTSQYLLACVRSSKSLPFTRQRAGTLLLGIPLRHGKFSRGAVYILVLLDDPKSFQVALLRFGYLTREYKPDNETSVCAKFHFVSF